MTLLAVEPTTYLEFHLLFLAPVIAGLLVLSWWRGASLDRPVRLAGVVILLVLAVLYTTPWDNLLIEQGVWSYGDGVVWQHLWAAPVGEYLFFVFQPLVTVLFLAQFQTPTDTDLRLPRRARLYGIAGGVAVSVLGGAGMLVASRALYLGSLLLWAGPILAVQWGFGWTHLWRTRRTCAIAVLVPTLYLSCIDYVAISLGLWTLSDTYTLGVGLFGLPIEEVCFFLLTNVFVVQGFVLYVWLVEQWPTVADSPLVSRYRQYAPVLLNRDQ